MNNALTLYRLQQVDTRLGQIESRLQAIQFTLENDAELKAARQRLEQSEHVLKQAENNSQDQRIKLEYAEASLYGGRIHNPKELQDLQNDVASLKRHLRELEDIQLEAMLSIESVREALQEAQADYHVTQGRNISQNAALHTEQDSLQKERDRFKAQRLAVVGSIDAAALSLYDDLRQRYRGVAVATVSESSCEACGSSLTPGFAQSVRISNQIVHCPMCGRILYSN
jgi:predicted  nucleic acid-binding Zn-ribbon protein